MITPSPDKKTCGHCHVTRQLESLHEMACILTEPVSPSLLIGEDCKCSQPVSQQPESGHSSYTITSFSSPVKLGRGVDGRFAQISCSDD